MELSYYISKAIKNYLSERGIKSYRLAEASGCNKTALNNWLYQRRMPSAKDLIRLADYMNLSLDYMLGRSNRAGFIGSGTPSSFRERMSELKRGARMSSYRLAAECGVGTAAVSKWNAPGRLPRPETLVRIADAFGCSVDYLVGRTTLRYPLS